MRAASGDLGEKGESTVVKDRLWVSGGVRFPAMRKTCARGWGRVMVCDRLVLVLAEDIVEMAEQCDVEKAAATSR
jgi:hypothetical protein